MSDSVCTRQRPNWPVADRARCRGILGLLPDIPAIESAHAPTTERTVGEEIARPERDEWVCSSSPPFQNRNGLRSRYPRSIAAGIQLLVGNHPRCCRIAQNPKDGLQDLDVHFRTTIARILVPDSLQDAPMEQNQQHKVSRLLIEFRKWIETRKMPKSEHSF